jgi:hypothetical protein
LRVLADRREDRVAQLRDARSGEAQYTVEQNKADRGA